MYAIAATLPDRARLAEVGEQDLAAARALLRRGLAIVVLGLGGLLVWSLCAPLDHAAAGSGVVATAQSRQAIQHPAGGVVQELAVREGDTVAAGQLLLRLDMRAAEAERATLQRQALLLAASRERLRALLEGREQLAFAAETRAQAEGIAGAESMLQTQRQLFASQRHARSAGQHQQLARGAQLRAELGGHERQIEQARAQRALVEGQVAQFEELAASGFVSRMRVVDSQRQLLAARQDEQRSLADAARTREALAEAAAAQAQRGSEQSREWEAELLDGEHQEAALRSRLAALSVQIAQAELRAPADGQVVGLALHTLGGVAQPGQVLMEIVPAGAALLVDARFPLAAAERLQPGQRADLRLPSLDQTRTPVIEGEVLSVSADRLEDARSGEPYLRVRVALPAAERQRLEAAAGVTLRAGLPAEVLVRLGERSLWAYLTKPLLDRVAHGFID